MSEQGAGAAAAQGGENGNGNGGEPSGLYAEVLQGVPDELKPYVEGTLKTWDQKVNPRLQEAAQIRQQYEPLAGVDGLSDVPPDALGELVQFHQLLENPQSVSEEDRQALVGQIANLLGVQAPQGLSEEDWVSAGQENGWFDGDEGAGAASTEDIVQRVVEALRPEIEPVKQFMGNQQQQQAQQQQVQQFESRLGEVLKETPEDQRDRVGASVLKLAAAFLDDEDPIGKAFEEYQQIRGGAQGDLVDEKLQQPSSALHGGRASAEQPRVSWNGGTSPKELAAARLRA